MGRLAKITLVNFKSYKGKVVADLGKHYFTSIIGPNGAGKSNLMDAISFVLGMGLKEMRSTSWDDLIYRGSSTSSECHVEATYETDDDTTLVLRRVIVASQANTKFFIDNEQVTNEEYKQRLAEHNILVEARNFLVFQGDIEAIASRSSHELADLIEQVSGSIEYRSEYDRLRKKLDKAKSDALSTFSDRRNVQSDIRQYSEQRDTKAEAAKLKKQLQDRKLDKVAVHLQHVDKRTHRLETRQEEINEELVEAEHVATKHSKASDKAQVALAKEKKKQLKLRSDESSLDDEISRVQRELAPIDRKLELTASEAGLLEPKIQYAEKELETFEADLNQVNKSIKVAERSQVELEQSSANSSSKLKDLPVHLIEMYDQLKEQFTVDTASEQSTLDAIQRKRRVAQDELQSVKTEHSELQARLDSLTEKKQLAELRLDQEQSSVEAFKKQYDLEQTALKEVASNLHILRDSQEDANRKLVETTAQIKALDNGKRDAQRRHKLLDNVSKLKRIHPGVVDVMSNLVTPKEHKFQRAVDRVLGGWFDAVVVDTFATAKECVERVRADNMGRMTFLPLDNLKVDPIDSALRTVHKGARLAIDAMDFNERLKLAVAFVCGDTLLCDTPDVASELRWNSNIHAKMVSLDGSVIHTNNIMTGGVTRSTDRYDDRKVVSLQRQAKNLVEKLKALNNEQSELREREITLLASFNKIKEDIKYHEEASQVEAQKIESRKRELEHLQDDVERVTEKMDLKQSKLDKCNEEYEALSDSLSNKEREVFEPFTSEAGFDVTEFETGRKELSEIRGDYAKQRSRLQDQFNFAESRVKDAKARLDTLTNRHSTLVALGDELTSRKEQLGDELEGYKAEKSTLSEKLDDIKIRVDARNDEMKSIDSESSEAAEKVQQLTRQIKEIEDQLVSAREDRENVLKDARIDGLVLTEKDLENIEERASSSDSQTTSDLAADIAAIDTEIKRLEEQIETIVVNNYADSHLVEAEGRLEAVDAEFRDRRDATEAVQREFDAVKEKRRERFLDAFDVVRESIDGIYKELTTNSSHPLGGSANLVAVNAEEPYLEGITYAAMPPTKRFTNIEQLSGGEKAMAALALLFAIHRYRPSAFFVLDEVDAALDYANVEMVSNYIKKHAGPNYQFIVISLKIRLFEKSDSLVGVHRQQGVEGSRLLMVDLAT